LLLEDQAEKVAARVDATKVGFDPITIIAIITQVLPLLLQCFNRNDEPTPAQVSASFKAAHAKNPDQLRRRTMRRVRSESDESLTKSQAFALADAVIEQALDTDESTAVACAMEAGV